MFTRLAAWDVEILPITRMNNKSDLLLIDTAYSTRSTTGLLSPDISPWKSTTSIGLAGINHRTTLPKQYSSEEVDEEQG